MPGEEAVRSGSGSSSSSPPDPPGSSTSDSSSGVHSAASMPAQRPRANSLDEFVLEHQPKEENRLKSFSLQRGVLPPTATSTFTSPETHQPIYGFSGMQYTTVHTNINGHVSDCNIPSTIIESSNENTVIIRRKSMQPKVKSIIPQPVINEEPFGRPTNMKMTTFTNSKESLKSIVASSATLPHYPTQQVDVVTPNCSTMPLSFEARGVLLPQPMNSGSSCHSFSRPHCTLPNHQGGLRLVGAVPAIRRPPARPRAAPTHHSFPVHLLQPTHYGMHTNHHQINQINHETERDSANFSMASSGDSDNNMYVSVNRA